MVCVVLITISREFAAGGSVISRAVAEALGWELIDNEFVQRVAVRSGLDPEEVAELEERPTSFAERFAKVASAYPDSMLGSVTGFDLEEERLARATREIVKELAVQGRCVLVGRASAAVLATDSGVLRVRVVAPLDARLARARERLGLDEDSAARRLHEADRNRERYIREFYGRAWDDALNYHMVLNTDALGYDGTVAQILKAAESLGWSPAS